MSESELDALRASCEAYRIAIKAWSEQRQKAVDLMVRYGGIDGDHHKAWVIDQTIRILTGDDYDQLVKDSCAGEDGPDTYEWDTGIAP
jgi:hypothetical protein